MADQRTRDRAEDERRHPIEIEPRRARAGFFGRPIFYVLIAGLVLVILAFLIIWFVIPPPRGANHATFLIEHQARTLAFAPELDRSSFG
ncbi:MAG TPA: hypothetical protein VKV77_13640 [Methylovirgula sp.]|nr:hypothetical protein [Methylovirgula sp.]